MPRRPASVTQADIARAIRALRDAGAPMERVRVRLGHGSVIVEVGDGAEYAPEPPPERADERRVIAL